MLTSNTVYNVKIHGNKQTKNLYFQLQVFRSLRQLTIILSIQIILTYKIFLFKFTQKQQVSIVEGLCKGHGCLNRTEIITLTAILKSANVFKEASNASVEQQTGVSINQGDDFFQRLQTAFTETGEEHASNTKDKSGYCLSLFLQFFYCQYKCTLNKMHAIQFKSIQGLYT